MARAIIRNKYSLHFGRLFGKVFWFYWVSCYQEPFLPSVRSSSVQITNYHQIVSNLLIASESTRLIIREETAFKVLLRPNRGSRKLHFVWKKKQYLKSSTELQKVTKIINILWINSQFGTFLKNWFEIFFHPCQKQRKRQRWWPETLAWKYQPMLESIWHCLTNRAGLWTTSQLG